MADPPPSPPPQSTSSYIYPVRSLLSGIQPAPDADAPPPPESNVLASLRRDVQLRAERSAQQPPSSTTPKSPSPGLGARRGVAPQGSLPMQRSFLRDESVFSAPLPTNPEASSPTFFSAQLSGSPLARRQSTTDSPEPGPSARRVVSGLEHKDAPPVTSPSPPSPPPPPPEPEPFYHYPAEGRDGFRRLLHLPESVPIPNEAEVMATAAGMSIVMHDSVDGAVIRDSVHGSRTSKSSKASASGTGTGTSNTGTDASVRVSQTGSAQPSGAASIQRSGTSSVQPVVPGAVAGATPRSRPESSQNASELLGLTPKYLFSLDCFTQTLPDSQADILWDNVQFLHDPELDANDTADDSPQVFLLSGWGEPGSGLRDGGYYTQGAFGPAPSSSAGGQRREWTCWCAAHRPKQSQKPRDFPFSSEDSSAGESLSSCLSATPIWIPLPDPV
ncbi:Light-sensor Protein kinase [Ceratobasidium sp. UAMH 11750]|nr:Light-sensor Protein kinase [Ceratobasidium sp. UAMH 11750]